MRFRLFASLRAKVTSSARSLVPVPVGQPKSSLSILTEPQHKLSAVHSAAAIRGTDFMEYRRRAEHYSALMLADLITLPHFSVSSAMSLPKSAGVNASVVTAKSARRALNFGFARAALISLLSLSTISIGVPFGAPTPDQVLAS